MSAFTPPMLQMWADRQTTACILSAKRAAQCILQCIPANKRFAVYFNGMNVLQTDVDCLVEEVSIASAASPGTTPRLQQHTHDIVTSEDHAGTSDKLDKMPSSAVSAVSHDTAADMHIVSCI